MIEFVGIIVTLFVQWLKKKLKTDEYSTLVIVAFVSIIAATVYAILGGTEFWETLVRIVEVAGAIYAYIILRFKDIESPPIQVVGRSVN